MPATTRETVKLSDDERRQLEALLAQFDRSWTEQSVAQLPQQLPATGPLRQAALIEGVKIDLRHRWGLGRKVLIDGYLKRFAELGTAGTVPVDLILAELEVRRQFGSSVSLSDYAGRFPDQFSELKRLVEESGPGPASSSAPAASHPPVSTLGDHTTATRPPTPVAPAPAPVGQPAPSSLPEQFGRYRILKTLGKGGMGAVYLAHDTQLDRQIALKVPHFQPEHDSKMLKRFIQEARAASTLNHPNLCPVHDVGEIDGIHYLTMAYIEGQTLHEVIRGRAGLPARSVAALVRKLALALHEAHAKGVIHRDLKPANIMINRRHEPIIMDFGLARRGDQGDVRLTQSGAVMGTPAYMPPEQVKGDVKAMGPACDIYSLGVILYELLTGQLPFRGSMGAVMGQIICQDPEPPSKLRPDVDPALEAICRKAMAKKIEDRYATMGEFAAACTKFLRGDGPVANLPVARLAPDEPTKPGVSDDGLATQLLAKLAAKLDEPKKPVTPDRGRGPLRGLLVGAALMVLLLVGAIVYMAITAMNKPNKTDVTTTVVVELPKIPEAADPSVVFVLDGQIVTPQELSKPRSIRTGDHELVMKRGEQILATWKFRVDEGDKAVALKDPREKPSDSTGAPANASQEFAPELSNVVFPFRAAWDTCALRRYFTVGVASYEPETKMLSWLVEVKRGFRNSVRQEIKININFVDSGGFRVQQLTYSKNGFEYVPRERVAKDDRVRITLALPGPDVWAKTAKVVLADLDFPDLPALEKARPMPPPEPLRGDLAPELDGVDLTFKAAWDSRALQNYFAIKEASYDPDTKKVTWVGQAKRGFRDRVRQEIKIDINFVDADGVRVQQSTYSKNGFEYEPGEQVDKDTKVRITLALPDRTILKQTSRVVLVDQDPSINQGPPKKEPEPAPRVQPAKPSLDFAPELNGLELPFQATWDTRALRRYFTVGTASYDPETKQLSWLVAAKRGFINEVWGETKLDIDFIAAAGNRLERYEHNRGSRGLHYVPDRAIAKDDRIRITIELSDRELWKKTAKLVLVDQDHPEPPAVEKPEPLKKLQPDPGDLAPELQGVDLGFVATWDTRALRRYFTLAEKASYDPETKKVMWHGRTTRGFRHEIWAEARINVDFYDAEDVRVYRFTNGRGAAGLSYSPERTVAKDTQVGITHQLPDRTILKQTTRVVLVDLDQAEPPVNPAPKPKPADPPSKPTGPEDPVWEMKGVKLPFTATWDTRAFGTFFIFRDVTYDPAKKVITWLVTAKQDFGADIRAETKLVVDFYTTRNVQVYRTVMSGGGSTSPLEYTPAGGAKKGQNVEIQMKLPGPDILKRTAKAVVLDPDNPLQGRAPDPGPGAKPAEQKKDAAFANAPELKDLELPFEATWDTRAFKKHFTMIKAIYDAEAKELTWLVKANRGFGKSIASETKLRFDFLDANNIPLHRIGTGNTLHYRFKPLGDVKRGGDLAVILPLTPADLAKTVKVVLVDENEENAKPKK